jgi:hypothetical protein
MKNHKNSTDIQDVTDVHVTSNDTVVDCFSQYPLLQGEKKYTVQVTEFCCPLTSTALPTMSFFEDDASNTREYFFEIKRKRATLAHYPMNSIHDSMAYVPAVGDLPGAAMLFPDDSYYKFRKAKHRKLSTVGGLVYSLHKFFQVFIQKYRQDQDTHQVLGVEHGGLGNTEIHENTSFVTTRLTPNGTLTLTFSPLFTKNFYIEFTSYGKKILGISESILAFRQDGDVLHTGLAAIVGGDPPLLIGGGTNQSVEVSATYSLYRFFDQRIRLELETQMGTPQTNVWSTSGTQQITTNIATFPIQTKHTVTVRCDSDGTMLSGVENTDELMEGEIIWRKAEDKITERYLINNSKYFHNIRLELFIVKRKWINNSFKFIREKVTFESGEYWTAKLRFRSL